ncbi:nitrite reductase (NAD(P)H), large subunit [gamma proteobacterium HTCC5015]|nr:nitrite reductase (NAD(P)H), large subunit [gamma proteobacterium HTCC5015]
MSKQQLVVIGNGMVGHNFLTKIVEAGGLDQYEITTFCEEPRAAYDRVHLSEYFGGRSADDLSMVEGDFFNDNGITLHLNDRAVRIDRENKIVHSSQGLALQYDKVVLATGSYPFVPPVPGHDREHCLVYRTIEDLEAIMASGQQSKVGAVVGGGLLGLEAANALKQMGLETHVVEFAPRLMMVQVDEGGGALLRRKIEDLGVSVHTSKNTQNIGDGERCRHKMEFADGEVLETDLILFSAGIRPRDDIAREAGLKVGERGGIEIDNCCVTSDDDIYAIGECALWDQRIFGLVAPGYQMAQVAVDQLLGKSESVFTGADMSTKLKLMGVDVASIGDAHGNTPGALTYEFSDGPNQIYKRIVISEDSKKLLGAVLVGDASDYGNLLQVYLNGIDLPEHPDGLILPQRDGASSAAIGVDALPETAQICSCHAVSKGDIAAAIDGGACCMGDVKEATKAATGCGGCAALTKQVLDAELMQRGVEVNTDICDHFPYTRQDLYNLVRVGEIKSFQELLDKHGKGHGCEICKPAVANILASCWNEHILQPMNVGLQDTNDIYLGNMQKDGTYSIVPRVAGGEITPEKLIVLGEVAKEYGLYTKITGGQRVDLFGARLEQLPEIWRKLVDAGFETGHAYGKSVRTVKSCVGSTWCRYGVDDSVGLAIDIEHRYKGLRSPHKLKFAVSGCTRECAEAQSKDIGVIATENGWNLYVCGNGGMKPRHADLFASDLDRKTLVQYIDRILMFYIRTADRLQRTSVWMDNLKGGLDYLREVIIEDKLGIGQELEEEMAHVISTYECEWKAAIEDPEKVKRFRSFINSEAQDENILFVEERDQIRPATPEEKIELKQSA